MRNIDVSVGLSISDFKLLQDSTYLFNEAWRREKGVDKCFDEYSCLRLALLDFYDKYSRKVSYKEDET